MNASCECESLKENEIAQNGLSREQGIQKIIFDLLCNKKCDPRIVHRQRNCQFLLSFDVCAWSKNIYANGFLSH